MLIIIGNQKGGAGKSTITLLLAYYLSLLKKQKVIVLDMDYQQSIASKAEKAKILDDPPLYEVVPADLKHFPAMYEIMKNNKREYVLIDLPGKMDDDGLIPVFSRADLIFCPFSYDELSVDSTLLFTMVVRKINPRISFVFLPNRIKNTVRYETKIEVDKLLTDFGPIAPAISDRVDFQRITTFNIPVVLAPVIIPVLDLIYDQYLKLKE
ncbi:ParA family protein [Desertivirga brevis]|uniref:ParA family protein n=1 Tax=Desertivirga brevis TaxID=2810310 RepID=UPI001A964DCA|nr:ParA family protein [Pedobacter sp. SYSU D00873]